MVLSCLCSYLVLEAEGMFSDEHCVWLWICFTFELLQNPHSKCQNRSSYWIERLIRLLFLNRPERFGWPSRSAALETLPSLHRQLMQVFCWPLPDWMLSLCLLLHVCNVSLWPTVVAIKLLSGWWWSVLSHLYRFQIKSHNNKRHQRSQLLSWVIQKKGTDYFQSFWLCDSSWT